MRNFNLENRGDIQPLVDDIFPCQSTTRNHSSTKFHLRPFRQNNCRAPHSTVFEGGDWRDTAHPTGGGLEGQPVAG
jgi:hypothetical protein